MLGQNLGVEAIQEFSVLTSNYSAEYGKTSGGVVNAISRSGTNQFHGSVYEFLRKQCARTHPAISIAVFHRRSDEISLEPRRAARFEKIAPLYLGTMKEFVSHSE